MSENFDLVHFVAGRICFEEFGDRVKIWITLNEPWVVAVTNHHLLLCHHHRLTIAIFFIVAATTFLTIITIFFPVNIILIILSQVLGHGQGLTSTRYPTRPELFFCYPNPTRTIFHNLRV